MAVLKGIFGSNEGRKLVRRSRNDSQPHIAPALPPSPPAYDEIIPIRTQATETASQTAHQRIVFDLPSRRRPAPSIISVAPSEVLPAYDDVSHDRIPYQSMHPLLAQRGPHDVPFSVQRRLNSSSTSAPRHASGSQPDEHELAKQQRIAALFSRLPEEAIRLVGQHLSLDDDKVTAACLKLTSRRLYSTLPTSFFTNLDDDLAAKLTFLHRALDSSLPKHLLCTNCVRYHVRASPNLETISTHHDHIAAPVFVCPALLTIPTPRLVLTPNRRLPFTLAQLLARNYALGPAHGISRSAVSQTFSDKAWGFDDADDAAQNWVHNVSLIGDHGHILLRVESTHPTPSRILTASEINRLLISRESYAPYFSTCQHWSHGGAMIELTKCALSHHQQEVAKEAARKPIAGVKGSASSVGSRVPSLCAECRPVRRCDDCGTEYHISLRLAEDRAARRRSSAARSARGLAAPAEPPRFITHLCVVRYSDLGQCKHSDELDWRSVAGDSGERENDVVRSECRDIARLRSVRAAWEVATGMGVGTAAKPVSLTRKIEWVRAHCREMEEERRRVRGAMHRTRWGR